MSRLLLFRNSRRCVHEVIELIRKYRDRERVDDEVDSKIRATKACGI